MATAICFPSLNTLFTSDKSDESNFETSNEYLWSLVISVKNSLVVLLLQYPFPLNIQQVL